MEVRGQLDAPAALLQGNRSRYPLDTTLAMPQSRSGHCVYEKNLAMLGLEPRS
jgi:hypothetical protein